jgi:hypothetical protein
MHENTLFDSGDKWSIFERVYSVESKGSQSAEGSGFTDCIRIDIDDSQNINEY